MGAQQVHDQVQHSVISRDGTPIVYWRSGQGRPLVLVHGGTADHSRWRPVLWLFEAEATACAVDRRGRGASGDTEPYAIEREFEDVAAVVDALAEQSGEPVDLFGHSYGGACALEGALLTANLRRLVLYEAPVAYDPDARSNTTSFSDRASALLAEGRREELIETFFREVARVPEDELEVLRSLPAWPARVAAAHTVAREERAALGYRFDPARFASLRVPTLLLVGSESPMFLRRSTDLVAAALPDVRVHTLEGQQHVAIDTAPDLLARTVLSHLR